MYETLAQAILITIHPPIDIICKCRLNCILIVNYIFFSFKHLFPFSNVLFYFITFNAGHCFYLLKINIAC